MIDLNALILYLGPSIVLFGPVNGLQVQKSKMGISTFWPTIWSHNHCWLSFYLCFSARGGWISQMLLMLSHMTKASIFTFSFRVSSIPLVTAAHDMTPASRLVEFCLRWCFTLSLTFTVIFLHSWVRCLGGGVQMVGQFMALSSSSFAQTYWYFGNVAKFPCTFTFSVLVYQIQ